MSVSNELYKHLSKIIHGILRDMYDFTLGGGEKIKIFDAIEDDEITIISLLMEIL